jgi:quaternary ammonium compound-resistance protein SugE
MKRAGARRLPIVRGAAFVMPARLAPREGGRYRIPAAREEDLAWFWLIVGGLFEVGFTTSLRFVEGFRNLPWTGAFLVSVAISMALLEYAARSIPMGTAYAVWGGIGAIGTVMVGMLWFGEPATTMRMLLILGIVACIAGLRLTA